MLDKHCRARIEPRLSACPINRTRVCIRKKTALTTGRKRGTYGVVDVRADDEAFTTAITAVVDSDDVSGLCEWSGWNQSDASRPREHFVSDGRKRSERERVRTMMSSLDMMLLCVGACVSCERG